MKFIILVALFALAAAEYNTAPAREYEESQYDQPAQPYSFGYDVKDSESYNDFEHSENNDGKVTTGSYRVALPDGRTQIVTYRADAYGYTAEVQYEGEARYPEEDEYHRGHTYSHSAY